MQMFVSSRYFFMSSECRYVVLKLSGFFDFCRQTVGIHAVVIFPDPIEAAGRYMDLLILFAHGVAQPCNQVQLHFVAQVFQQVPIAVCIANR